MESAGQTFTSVRLWRPAGRFQDQAPEIVQFLLIGQASKAVIRRRRAAVRDGGLDLLAVQPLGAHDRLRSAH
jgi:hypothetical protein